MVENQTNTTYEKYIKPKSLSLNPNCFIFINVTVKYMSNRTKVISLSVSYRLTHKLTDKVIQLPKGRYFDNQ